MSYARFAEDSDVYLFVTRPTPDGDYVIECCGCRLVADLRKPRTDAERAKVAHFDTSWAGRGPEEMVWDWSPVQHFRTLAEVLDHLRKHEEVGHKVPAYAIAGITEDGWPGT